MAVVEPGLRLSAQRALLGAVHPGVRLVKVRRDGNCIVLTTICDGPFEDDLLDALSTAAAEIAADYPDCDVDERISISTDPLPKEDILAEGWIFQRAEPSVRQPSIAGVAQREAEP